MPTSAAGSEAHLALASRFARQSMRQVNSAVRRCANRCRGFTLIELMVVVALIAIASGGVALTLRDGGEARLDRDAERLAAQLESARAQSRASGTLVRWRAVRGGFVFDGLPARPSPQQWLDPSTQVVGNTILQLGPEPLIAPQQVMLATTEHPERMVRVATDGLRPFAVQPGSTTP